MVGIRCGVMEEWMDVNAVAMKVHEADRVVGGMTSTNKTHIGKSARTPVDPTAIVSHSRGKITALLAADFSCGARAKRFMYSSPLSFQPDNNLSAKISAE
jgi:hypothetical protein